MNCIRASRVFFGVVCCLLAAVGSSSGVDAEVKAVSPLAVVDAPLSAGPALSSVGLPQWGRSVELAAILRQDPSLASSVSVSVSPSLRPSIKSIPEASALAWVSSPAYAAACRRAFDAAWLAVESSARFQTEDWAVVLDVDDTVLQTWNYGRRLSAEGRVHTPDEWKRWILSGNASAVPGAEAFLRNVRSLGPRAHAVFITDDGVEHEDAKKQVLTRLGLLEKDDIFLSKTGNEDTKKARRRCLQDGAPRCGGRPLRVIASIGDNIRDHVDVTDGAEVRELRRRILNGRRWCPDGVACIMLPNPVYGDWEFDYGPAR